MTCVGARDGLWVLRGEARLRAALAGPASPDIAALVVDGDRVWVGTFDAGLGYPYGEKTHPPRNGSYSRKWVMD